MDIGDLIYVVLMVGAIIASIVKKAMDKGKQADTPKPQIPEMMQEMFPNLKDLIAEDEEIEPSTVVIEEEKTKKEELPNKAPYFSYDNLEDISQAPIVETHSWNESDQEEDEEEDTVFLDEKFDLRKAVIYSEIVNRPEHCKF